MREKFFIVRGMWAYRAKYLIDKKKNLESKENYKKYFARNVIVNIFF